MKSIKILCCLFLFTLSLIAQFNETIPTTHWIYHSIEKLQIGGYLRDLEQGCQPYTRMQIARAIIQNEKSDIQNVRLKNDAKKNNLQQPSYDIKKTTSIELNRIKKELKRELKYLHNENDRNSFSYIKLGGTGSANFEQSGETSNKSFIRIKSSLSLNDNITIKYNDIIDRGLIDDPLYIGDEWRGWAGYQEQVYIAYNTSFLELKYGRDYVKWGYGKRGRLLISDASRPFDMLSLKVRSNRLSFQTIMSQLNTVDSAQRYLTAVRIEWNPFDNLYLGVAQAGLYGDEDQSLDFTLSNPFSISYFAQHNDPKHLNAMIYLDAAYYWKNRYKFYGELLIDDFQVDEEIESDLEPNELGFILGIEGIDLWEDINGWCEFTQVRNRTYNTQIDYEKFLHRNQPIGHWLGTDFQRFQFQLDRWMNPKVRLECGYDLIRKGEGTIRGEFTTPWMDEDVTMETGYIEKIPYGIVETTNRIYSTLHYKYNSHIHSNLQLGYKNINNLDHVSGEKSGNFYFNLSLWVDVDRYFKTEKGERRMENGGRKNGIDRH